MVTSINSDRVDSKKDLTISEILQRDLLCEKISHHADQFLLVLKIQFPVDAVDGYKNGVKRSVGDGANIFCVNIIRGHLNPLDF